MEDFKQINNEISKNKKEFVFDENEGILKNDIKEKTYQKDMVVNNTLNNIDNIRSELGLEPSNEIPPSVTTEEQNLINNFKKSKSNLEMLDFTIINPEKEEIPEEYVSRALKSIVNEYINNEPNIKNLHRLIKRAYYGKYANQSIVEFFSNIENSKKIKDALFSLESNNDKKFSKEKNDGIFNKLSTESWGSSRESADGDNNKKAEYYSNTNQERDFFSYGRKHDAFSYSSMMFGLPEDFIKTEEGKEYLHNKLDNKTIFLFGGGDSIKDLLKSEEFKPKKVINFDPFIKEETFDKNPNGIYESQMISASDKKIRELAEKNEIPKADEVWATYSVPFYLDSSKDIKELISNMSQVLSEGGNARISPIAVQSKEKDGENFETRKHALIDSVKSLLDNPDYNVTIFNDTLKIHKIKKEKNK